MQSEHGLANAVTLVGHTAYAAWLAGGPWWLGVASLVADELDGRIARATKTTSREGELLDWGGDLAGTALVAQRLGIGPGAAVITAGQVVAKSAGVRPPVGSVRAVLTLAALWLERNQRRETPARELADDTARAWMRREARRGLVELVERADGRVSIGPWADGVRLLYQGRHAVRFEGLTPRLAVFIVRLATWARTALGATELHHLGAAPGMHAGAHPEGRAIDLSAVLVRGQRVSVAEHWRTRPDVWHAVYRFATEQAKDRTYNGLASSILSPAHPTHAASHADHMHIEVP